MNRPQPSMQAHNVQNLHAGDSYSSEEIADLDYSEEDPEHRNLLGPQHLMMPDNSDPSDEDDLNNHQDTGSGDQGSNDYI